MTTNWTLIREAVNTAIDSCERLENLGYAEQHRILQVDVDGRPISVYSFLVSAWTLPENVRYEIVRTRHDENIDLRYVPETARILTAVTAACSELIGAGGSTAADEWAQGMIRWYRDHFDPHVERAIKG